MIDLCYQKHIGVDDAGDLASSMALSDLQAHYPQMAIAKPCRTAQQGVASEYGE
jgi:hypothetical protein